MHVDLAVPVRTRLARVREAGRFVRARPSGGRGVLQPQGPTDRGDPVHIVLHTFRQAAAARIRVGDDAVRYEPVAAAWVDGTVQLPEGPKLESLLKRAGITRTKLGMLLRNHSDVWLLEPV